MSIFRQPLVQFLLGGIVLYGLLLASNAGGQGDEGDKNITVTQASLLTYLQFQDKAFDAAQARELFNSLDDEARARLVDEYVRDEIMVREAVDLGLDENDDVIRQRLIQKMDFLFQGFADDMAAPDEDVLADYFAANKDRYQEPAQATFTHIFFNVRDRDRDTAQKQAQDLLSTLNTENVPFEAAGRYGDRFFFLRNYVNRSQQLIEDHFGPEMTEQVFAIEAQSQWVGPFSSRYGEHLVLLRNRADARALSLTEARDRVRDDVLRERRDQARRAAFEDRAKNYSVDIRMSAGQ